MTPVCHAICSAGSPDLAAGVVPPAAPSQPQHTVIPGADSLIGDLLDMDLGPPMHQQQFQQPPSAAPTAQSSGAIDLLGEGLDSLVNICLELLLLGKTVAYIEIACIFCQLCT